MIGSIGEPQLAGLRYNNNINTSLSRISQQTPNMANKHAGKRTTNTHTYDKKEKKKTKQIETQGESVILMIMS
jgi:hypothetical protein